MSYELVYKLTHYPGFVYKMNDHYYYIGRCQFEEVTDQDVTDSYEMFHIFGREKNNLDTAQYFAKLRAYADMALTPPADPEGAKKKLEEFLDELNPMEAALFGGQVTYFEHCFEMFNGPLDEVKMD